MSCMLPDFDCIMSSAGNNWGCCTGGGRHCAASWQVEGSCCCQTARMPLCHVTRHSAAAAGIVMQRHVLAKIIVK